MDFISNNWFDLLIGLNVLAGMFGFGMSMLDNKKKEWYVILLEIVNGAVQTAQVEYNKKKAEYMEDGKIDEVEAAALKKLWKHEAFDSAISDSQDQIRLLIPSFLHGAYDKLLPALVEKYVYRNKEDRKKAIVSGNPS